MIELGLTLLVAQAVLGAFDTIYHHEAKVGLPRSATAAPELRVHALRAVLYAVVFYGLAWRIFGGLWVLVLVLLVAVEVGLTLWDFVIEDDTRLLPRSERIVHTILAINGGAAFALIALDLPAWFALPTALHPVDHGWKSFVLTAAAAGVAVSGLRDAQAAWVVRRLDLDLGLSLGRAHRRLLMSGGTGFLGASLCRELVRAGHDVTLVSRRPCAASLQFAGRVRALGSTAELSAYEAFDAVVNLAGAPVMSLPWTAARKRRLLASRLDATADLVAFVRRAVVRPAVWIQASAVGYYDPHASGQLDETAPPGDGFASRMCLEWEHAIGMLPAWGVRCVVLRMGLVFGRGGGALPPLLAGSRLGAAAVLGTGQQRVAWIHIEDWLRLVARAIADPSVSGVLNAVAPAAPTYADFAHEISRSLQRPLWLRIPERWLRTALGEMATLLVDGPHVAPMRLRQLGFEFRFPDLRSTIADLA